MDALLEVVSKGNDFLWSFLLILLLCGTGVYYTVRLKFIQVRKFGEGCRQVFGHIKLNGEKHEKGEMSRSSLSQQRLQPRWVPVTWQARRQP